MVTKKQIIGNAGINWTKLHLPDSSEAIYYVFDTPSGRVFISTNYSNIYYTDDNGETWIKTSLRYVDVAGHCISPTGRIFITGDFGCRYSDDNGETWTSTNLSMCNRSCVTPTGRILVGGSYNNGLFYSDDNGATWTNKGTGNWSYPFHVSPTGRIFSGGAYSDDNGETWSAIPSSYNLIVLCVTFTGRVIAAETKGYHTFYSDDNGTTWTQIPGKPGDNYRLWSVTNTGRIIAAVASDYDNGLDYSDDNGDTWSRGPKVMHYNQGWFSVFCLSNGYIYLIARGGDSPDPYNAYCSAPEVTYSISYNSKPITGKQAKELVQQCKAYVQSLKNGN